LKSKKFSAAAADRGKKIKISQPPPPIACNFLIAAAEERKNIKNLQPPPPRKTSAYTSICSGILLTTAYSRKKPNIKRYQREPRSKGD